MFIKINTEADIFLCVLVFPFSSRAIMYPLKRGNITLDFTLQPSVPYHFGAPDPLAIIVDYVHPLFSQHQA
jgi:hypothetical protein